MRGCPDFAEDLAAQRAEVQIIEVLEQLGGVTILNKAQKERAASIMGQYIFDEMCGSAIADLYVDFANFPLDQAGQQAYSRGLNG